MGTPRTMNMSLTTKSNKNTKEHQPPCSWYASWLFAKEVDLEYEDTHVDRGTSRYGESVSDNKAEGGSE